MLIFCLSHSTMDGPTATNHAMLPSLGQKVKYIVHLFNIKLLHIHHVK